MLAQVSRVRYRRSQILYVLDGRVAVRVESKKYGKLSIKPPSLVPPLMTDQREDASSVSCRIEREMFVHAVGFDGS